MPSQDLEELRNYTLWQWHYIQFIEPIKVSKARFLYFFYCWLRPDRTADCTKRIEGGTIPKMETISDILNFSSLIFSVAFGKWEKVEGNIAPEYFPKCYLSIHTEISSYLFLLISKVEAAKVFRHEIFISKHWKKERNVKK